MFSNTNRRSRRVYLHERDVPRGTLTRQTPTREPCRGTTVMAPTVTGTSSESGKMTSSPPLNSPGAGRGHELFRNTINEICLPGGAGPYRVHCSVAMAPIEPTRAVPEEPRPLAAHEGQLVVGRNGVAHPVKRHFHGVERGRIDVDARRAPRAEINAGAGIEYFGRLGRAAAHGGSNTEASGLGEKVVDQVRSRTPNR